MDIKKMSVDELEKLSYLDIAYNIIKFNKKAKNTIELLKEICTTLNYSDKEYEELIGDFYTSLNLDKRFILVDGKWDLTENHSVKIVIDDDDDDEELEEYEDIDDDDEEDEQTEDDILSDETETMEDVEDDDEEDAIEDLSIVEEEEEQEDI